MDKEMRRKTEIWLFTIMILLYPITGFSEEFQSAASIQGVRPVGMGGAFAAVADDENLLFSNPAGLMNIEDSRLTLLGFAASLNVDTIRMWDELPASYWDTTEWRLVGQNRKKMDRLRKYEPLMRISNPIPIHITYIRPGFAFSLLNSELKNRLSFEGGKIKLTEHFDTLAAMSYAREIIQGLSVGATVKGIIQQQINNKEVVLLKKETADFGITFDGDIGALYDARSMISSLPLTIGASIQNLLELRPQYYKRDLEEPEIAFPGLPLTFGVSGDNMIRADLDNFKGRKPTSYQKRTFVFGMAYQPDWKLFSPYFPESLTFASDVCFSADVMEFNRIIHLGAEMKVYKWLSLRAGFHRGFSFGVGLKTSRALLDTMYATRLDDPVLADLPSEDLPANNFALSFMVRY